MTEEVGRGFARRVTKVNLAAFVSLLRDRSKEPNPQLPKESPSSGPPYGSSTDEVADTEALFDGTHVKVKLPFTFSSGIPRLEIVTGNGTNESGPPEGQIDNPIQPSNTVLIAEIPGPGRWSQASFSLKVFTQFFGAGQINLNHIDADGTETHEVANPIIKKSSNYCYELGAAAGLGYPDPGEGRPIGVFLRLEAQQFQYRLVMPSESAHAILDAFLATNWEGSTRFMRRVTTRLETLLGVWPAAPFSLTESGASGK